MQSPYGKRSSSLERNPPLRALPQSRPHVAHVSPKATAVFAWAWDYSLFWCDTSYMRRRAGVVVLRRGRGGGNLSHDLEGYVSHVSCTCTLVAHL